MVTAIRDSAVDGAAGDELRDRGAAGTGGATGGGAFAGGAFGGGLPGQRVGPTGERTDPLLGGADGEPHLHLVLPGRRHERGEPVAFVAGRIGFQRRRLGERGAALPARSGRPGPRPGPLRPSPGRRRDGRPRRGRSGRRHRVRRACGRPRCGRCRLPGAPASAAATASLRAATSSRAAASWARSWPSVDSAVDRCDAGLVDGGLHLDEALRLRRAAGRRVRADDVAVGRDRAQVRVRSATRSRGGVEVGHEHHVVQRAFQRRAERVGAADDVERPAGAGRQRDRARARCRARAIRRAAWPGRRRPTSAARIAVVTSSTLDTATASARPPSAAASAAS